MVSAYWQTDRPALPALPRSGASVAPANDLGTHPVRPVLSPRRRWVRVSPRSPTATGPPRSLVDAEVQTGQRWEAPSCEGIDPVSWFSESHSLLRLDRLLSSVGIDPVNWF